MTGVFPSTEDEEEVKGGGRKREAGREGGRGKGSEQRREGKQGFMHRCPEHVRS